MSDFVGQVLKGNHYVENRVKSIENQIDTVQKQQLKESQQSGDWKQHREHIKQVNVEPNMGVFRQNLKDVITDDNDENQNKSNNNQKNDPMQMD